MNNLAFANVSIPLSLVLFPGLLFVLVLLLLPIVKSITLCVHICKCM